MGKNNMLGIQSYIFKNKPVVDGAFSVVGVKEGQGPMKEWFDMILEDDTFGEKTWEKSESKMLRHAVKGAIANSGREEKDINLIFSGDLLNQLMSSAFMARDMKKPFIGLYGACSTMTQALLVSAVFVNSRYADNVVAAASSHFCTAERQFRMPLEHGNQRPPSAQWTATAAGAMTISTKSSVDTMLLTPKKYDIKITCATVGKVIDTGMKDANQMGAAMAPAAVDTILNHFEDTGRTPEYYDLILTGDLGFIGRDIAIDLFAGAGFDKNVFEDRYNDCGRMIYEKSQDVHSGGSGCGCSASVYSGYLFKKMKVGEIKRALIVSTGALLSTVSPFQGESIPGIAHAVALEVE